MLNRIEPPTLPHVHTVCDRWVYREAANFLSRTMEGGEGKRGGERGEGGGRGPEMCDSRKAWAFLGGGCRGV